MPRDHRPSRALRAFTLIEVMVVVVVLTIIMSMAIPRLGNTERRTFDLAADQVADLLMMYAQRDNLSAYPVGLFHDIAAGQLLVMVLDGTDDRGDWTVDRLARPVTLPPVVDQEMLLVYVDGEPVSIREWPLGNNPGQDRPTLEMVMQSIDGDQQITLTLPSYGMSPKRRWSDGTGQLGVRSTVDLDAQAQPGGLVMRSARPTTIRTQRGRRGIALVDVIVGGVMLGIGLAIVLSVASRALTQQTDGEKRMIASWLADELLNMVLVEGPEDYDAVHGSADRFEPPFDEFTYEVDIERLGRGEPYRVNATVTWPVGRTSHSVRVETLIAARLGETVQLREPYESVDRDARNFGEEDEAAGTGAGGAALSN